MLLTNAQHTVERRDQDQATNRTHGGHMHRDGAADAAPDHIDTGVVDGDVVEQSDRVGGQRRLARFAAALAEASISHQVNRMSRHPDAHVVAVQRHILTVAAEVQQSTRLAGVPHPAAQGRAFDLETEIRCHRRIMGELRKIQQAALHHVKHGQQTRVDQQEADGGTDQGVAHGPQPRQPAKLSRCPGRNA